MSQLTLLDDRPAQVAIAEGAWLLPRRALSRASAILAEIEALTARSPFRHMTTPGGYTMTAGLTNCGALGWTSDAEGYQYTPTDPVTGDPWPPMPEGLRRIACDAAEAAGYPGYEPDVCLMNRYPPGSRLTLHQDKNERRYDAPVVSISLGLTARFVFGGLTRKAPTQTLSLHHGDMLVWGGASRLAYHGVRRVESGEHPETGKYRYCLTFRRAG